MLLIHPLVQQNSSVVPLVVVNRTMETPSRSPGGSESRTQRYSSGFTLVGICQLMHCYCCSRDLEERGWRYEDTEGMNL